MTYLRSAPMDGARYVEHGVDPRATWLRPVVSLDFETYPFAPGRQFPRLVCGSFLRRFLRHKEGRSWGVFDDGASLVLERERALPVLRDILKPWDRPWSQIAHAMRAGTFNRPLLINQTIGFDLGVVCKEIPELTRAVFQAYRAGDVRCTETREKGRRAALGTMKTDQQYSLAALLLRHRGIDIFASKKGPDIWRRRYHELEGVRAEDYPAEAYDYAAGDPEHALDVFEAQALACAEEGWIDVNPWLDVEGLVDCPVDLAAPVWPDEAWQTWAAFWLKLTGAWGLKVDAAHVYELKAKLEANVDEAYSLLLDLAELPAGPLVATASRLQLEDALRFAGKDIRKQPSTWNDSRFLADLRTKCRRTFGIVCRKPSGEWKSNRYVVQARAAADVTGTEWPDEWCATREELNEKAPTWRDAGVPMSEPSETFPAGQPSYGAGELGETGDELLRELASVQKDVGELSKYMPFLIEAADSGYPVCSRLNVMVSNGRTSSSKPNGQNPPRRFGIREAFIPRPGMLFVNSDLDAAELCTLAQVCLDWFGVSELAEDLQAGRDAHLGVAAEILGISYEEALARKMAGDPEIKQARNCGKSGNFGAAGGLGEKTFHEFARDTYGVALSREAWITPDSDVEYRGALVYKIDGVVCTSYVLDVWRRQRPIIAGPFFEQIAQWCEEGERYHTQDGDTIKIYRAELLRSGRIRGGLGYTSGCNNEFSGPVADASKRAGVWIALECYLGDRTCDQCHGLGFLRDRDLRILFHDKRVPSNKVPAIGYSLEQGLRFGAPCPDCDGTGDAGAPSELDGCRPVNFLHDEHMLEAPIAYAAEAGERLSQIMIRELEAFCPDLAGGRGVGSTPWIMDRWHKAADEQRDAAGRLVTWKPKHKGA